MKALAVFHAVFAIAMLSAASWWAVAAFRILPHMSTGTVRSNLVPVAMLALTFSSPLAALGAWMLALARAIWRGDAEVRGRLLLTHGLLLVPALVAVAIGLADLEAARRSAAHGGGLLGGIGLVPLAIGGCLAVLNTSALIAACFLLRSPRT
jgi:hypothetical protein